MSIALTIEWHSLRGWKLAGWRDSWLWGGYWMRREGEVYGRVTLLGVSLFLDVNW